MEKKPHLLPPPHYSMPRGWKSEEIIEALEKSRAALLNLCSTSTSTSQHHAAADSDDLLIKLFPATVENLFLIDTTPEENGNEREIMYLSHGPDEENRGWEWGSRDMMLDMRHGATTKQERMAILTAAANLTGGAVHLLLPDQRISEEEEKAWVEALSLAADRHAGPTSLLIYGMKLKDAHGLLSALKKNIRLNHLSLQHMKMSDECIEELRDFASLTSLFLYVSREEEFNVGKLADLHPSHSPLAASLQRLYIISFDRIDWRRSTGFLRHWPHLKELSLKSYHDITKEELMDFMDHLAPPKKDEADTAGSTPSSPPELYRLQVGMIRGKELSRSATVAAVVDALSRSGLSFFSCGGLTDPAIEAQLWRNRRNFMLGSDLKRVPATSIRLFICGDPFAGKTTLVSTMRSIYGRKRDRLRALFTGERTKGIEVQAIKKEGIRVSLWDMAGQQEFHAFHDCMFPDIGTSAYQFPSMFMFVWSPMDSQSNIRGVEKEKSDFEISFKYWLRFLASKSRQSIIPLKVILVFTRADQMKSVSIALSDSINSLRSKFKRVIDIVDSPFDVDARNKDSVKPVAEHIFIVAKDVLQGIELYDICTQVSKNLLTYSKNTNKRIITWEEFSKIYNNDDKAKLNAVAMSLNESGNIIYVSGFKHIVLDPNWFCNEIIGSLIGFPNSKGASKGIVRFDKGCIPRQFLEQEFESIAKSNVKGLLLVDLMEAMHLCCKVAKGTTDLIFIPAILPDVGVEQLQWTRMDDNDSFVYMGRRLECENKDLTFLTPGLFPRIQALFSNAFQSKNDKIDIRLGKDFITIFLPKSEIIIVFSQANSNHVIDVLIQTNQNIDATKDMQHILAFVENRIINTLIKICAQPSGVQGVKLIESIIRPDCLRYPSKARDREDQCVEVTYLKEKLRKRLERGKKQSYDWKRTRHIIRPLSNDLIDLLGPMYYGEVCKSIMEWFKVEVRDTLLENDESTVDKSTKYESYENVIMTILENGTVQEDQLTLEEAREVQSSKVLVRLILNLHHKTDATHKNVLKLHDKMDQMTKELQCMRNDVLGKLENSISKLFKMTLQNEAEKQLPRVAVLTTKFPESIFEEFLRWVPQTLLGGQIIRIQLYCEYKKSPHPVENQPGMTLTSLSESQSKYLKEALPYIKHSFQVLSLAAKLGISFMTPLPSSSIPNWKPLLKLTKQYPMLQSHFGSKKDIFLSTLECASQEWQKCLASILRDNEGLTDENIAKKFHLKRYYEGDGSSQVAWLCKLHCEGKRYFPLG